MSFFTVIILGIIEGLTEFLPVSSTGHLILTSHILKLNQTEFLKTFEIAIQLGAILSVVVLYGKSLAMNSKIWKRVIAAFIPTGIIGFVLYKIIKHFFLSNTNIVIWSLFAGGVFLIIFELFHKEKSTAVENISDISYKQAFIIGIVQAVSVIPGVSRAAATIAGGMFLGLKRKTIVEFSFLLAVPTMGAAVGYDMLKTASSFTASDFIYLLLGFIVSFLIAICAIKFFLSFIKKNNFIPFGIYRIILAIMCWLIFFKA